MQKGGEVGVDLKDGKLVFSYGEVERKTRESRSQEAEHEAALV
jgi:hypothetical protein